MLVNGGMLPRTPQNSPTLTAAVRDYMEDYSKVYKGASSQLTDRTAFNGLVAVTGDISVFQLSKANVMTYIREEREVRHHKAATVNRRLNTIKHFIGWCFERGWTSINIAVTIKPVKGPSRESRALSNEEISKIFGHATEMLRLQIQIASTWGLRAGEVAALEWSWFNFEANLVGIGKTTSFSTKSGKSKTLPIPPRLREVLLRHRNVSGNSKWVFPNQWGTGHTKSHVISTAWRRAWRKAGIEYVRFHDLRATVGTRLAESGFGDAGVSRILGHESPNMARHYSKNVVAPIRGGIADIESSLPPTVLGLDVGTILPDPDMPCA